MAPVVRVMAAAPDDDAYVFIFDIETTGLSFYKHDITVVCGLKQSIAVREAYTELSMNLLATRDDAVAHLAQCVELCRTLDDARFISAYNGRRFDLPFVARWAQAQGVPADVAAWEAKTIDLYQLILAHVGVHYKLQRVCEANNLPVEKSATGLDAVRWAQSGEWALLLAYCMQDVHVLRVVLHHSVDSGLCIPVKRSVNSAFPGSTYVLRLKDNYTRVDVQPLIADDSPKPDDVGLLDLLESGSVEL